MKKIAKAIALMSAIFSFTVLAKPNVDLYKSVFCGCCKAWAKIMEDKGYEINVQNPRQWQEVKNKFGMPYQLQSCHTAVIDGYLIEGHVPEEDIARLLKERPKNISGIAVPGMPRFSPGMAAPKEVYKDFDVIAFDSTGKTSIYKSY